MPSSLAEGEERGSNLLRVHQRSYGVRRGFRWGRKSPGVAPHTCPTIPDRTGRWLKGPAIRAGGHRAPRKGRPLGRLAPGRF